MQCRFCQTEFEEASGEDICPTCRKKIKVNAVVSPDLQPSFLAAKSSEVGKADETAAFQLRGREIWRSAESAQRKTTWPISVAVHPTKGILVLDEPECYRILKLDQSGNPVDTLLEIPAEDEEGGVEDPQGLCVDLEGRIYIPDAGNDRISIWKSNGEFSHWLGGHDGLVELAHPTDVDVDGDGFLYVADTFNHRIQKLSIDGLVSLVVKDLGPRGAFRQPVAITTDGGGYIYVADGDLNVVIKLSPDGTVVWSLPALDQQDPHFDGLRDVRVGPDGSLYVSDCDNLRVRRFDPEGLLTGIIDIRSEAEEGSDAGDIALLDNYVLIPDRLNDVLRCFEMEKVGSETDV